MEEMPSLNMPLQRRKVAILPLDLPCSGPATHLGESLTTGKSHGKKPDRFSLNDKMDVEKVSRFKYIYIYIFIHFWRVSKIWKSDFQLRQVCSSVRPHRATRLPLEGFSWNLIIEYLYEDLCTSVIVSWWILLKTRNAREKRCRENKKNTIYFQ